MCYCSQRCLWIWSWAKESSDEPCKQQLPKLKSFLTFSNFHSFQYSWWTFDNRRLYPDLRINDSQHYSIMLVSSKLNKKGVHWWSGLCHKNLEFPLPASGGPSWISRNCRWTRLWWPPWRRRRGPSIFTNGLGSSRGRLNSHRGGEKSGKISTHLITFFRNKMI